MSRAIGGDPMFTNRQVVAVSIAFWEAILRPHTDHYSPRVTEAVMASTHQNVSHLQIGVEVAAPVRFSRVAP
jgi:hypothetical protein